MAWLQAAGASGTVTLPAGARLLAIRADSQSAAGTCTIFGGTAIPIVGNAPAGANTILDLRFADYGRENAPIAGATPTIIFANTVSYFVQYSI